MYNSIVFDFHESLCLFIFPLLFISHMFVTFRNSAERGKQVCALSHLFSVRMFFSRINIKVVWEKVKKNEKYLVRGSGTVCANTHTHT